MHNIKVFISSSEKKDSLLPLINTFTGKSSSGLVFGTVNVVEPSITDKYDQDYFSVYNLLKTVSDDDYLIFCKDTAVSASNSEIIYNIIEKSIELNVDGKFDLFYLAKWLDSCHNYVNFNSVDNTTVKIVDTVSPNGILCIMFSPSGRKKFLEIYDIEKNPILIQTATRKETLGHYLHNRIGLKTNTDTDLATIHQKFYAITTTPNLVNFSIEKVKSSGDYIKTVECRDVPTTEESQNSSSSSSMAFFWFIILVLAIIIIIFLFFRYYGSETPDNVKMTIKTQ